MLGSVKILYEKRGKEKLVFPLLADTTACSYLKKFGNQSIVVTIAGLGCGVNVELLVRLKSLS